MTADPLSAILSLIETRVVYSGGFSAGGAWAIRFPPPQKVKFFAIAHGSCFVTVDGLPDLFHLNNGDVFLLSAEAAFTVASDPALPPADALVVFDEGRSTFAHLGEGGDLLYLGSHLEFASKGSRLLIDSLPPVIHLSAGETGTGRLRWLIEELVRETTSTVPGTVAARSGLANLMFLQLLRGYLSQERGVHVGWLRAACDPKLAPALSLMHRDPARNWHLPELAKACRGPPLPPTSRRSPASAHSVISRNGVCGWQSESSGKAANRFQ
ncbi:cupin domain-containing protein [Ensifer adhaerens]|uniref:cupin domain-containing protein n=1 Tax=Ensifer adhaerens TaxID=106592 RepID=UPI000B07339C|nr:cupin domain-containing protein [Ensifer adhaerens]